MDTYSIATTEMSGTTQSFAPPALSNAGPKVSIVLPTHDGGQYICQSIMSCLDQTYPNLELIVVDDGSTENIRDRLQSISDRRMAYVRHETNLGLSRALNTGFARATGRFLTWTSDDNYYAENAIETMLSALRDDDRAFVYCDFFKFTHEDQSDRVLVRLPDIPELSRGNNVGPCFLYSKTVRQVVGEYDSNIALSEDYDYWIRVSKKFPMIHIAEPLYFYRERQVSQHPRRYLEVKAVDALVRLKHGLISASEATDSVLDLMSQQYPRRWGERGPLETLLSYRERSRALDTILSTPLVRKLYHKASKSVAATIASGDITRIFSDFSEEKTSFEDAEQAIRHIVFGDTSK